ncbi:hypothetical protein BDR22DRAFT_977713 [Usnea florida]
MDHQMGATGEEIPRMKKRRNNARECFPTPKRGGGQTATLNQSDDQDTKPVYILQYSPTRYLSTKNTSLQSGKRSKCLTNLAIAQQMAVSIFQNSRRMENKRLKSGPEAEDHQKVEGQVPTAVEQQEDESMPIELEQPANSLAPIFGQDRHTIPVIYVGNDLPETSTKRKRDNLGQSQEPVTRRPFAPKTSKTALGRPMGTAVEVTERSSAVAHVPSSPLGTVERPSSKIKRSVISTPKMDKTFRLSRIPTGPL